MCTKCKQNRKDQGEEDLQRDKQWNEWPIPLGNSPGAALPPQLVLPVLSSPFSFPFKREPRKKGQRIWSIVPALWHDLQSRGFDPCILFLGSLLCLVPAKERGQACPSGNYTTLTSVDWIAYSWPTGQCSLPDEWIRHRINYLCDTDQGRVIVGLGFHLLPFNDGNLISYYSCPSVFH